MGTIAPKDGVCGTEANEALGISSGVVHYLCGSMTKEIAGWRAMVGLFVTPEIGGRKFLNLGLEPGIKKMNYHGHEGSATATWNRLSSGSSRGVAMVI